ncbi:MAG TPA: hypothetical protein VNV44_14890 [Solirubrobacteraceae bacterium]|jgi:hypothetical protein|nr:hypothetical protein [Solirubrobacteraceae bacterium]
MGLLDDAIRDHLELKRRRGADPSEIAREEREALEPVFPDEPRPPGFEGEPQAGTVLDEQPPHGDPLDESVEAAEAAEAAEAQAVGQPLGDETVEIDMEAVLAADVPLGAETPAPEHAPPPPAAARDSDAVRPPPPGEEDLLEWEIPGDAETEAAPDPIPGQERMSFE